MEELKGIVERITYYDEESNFGVIKVKVKGYKELVVMTGKFIAINVGTIIETKGEFILNKKYGKQFNIQEYHESLPASIYGIEKYLGSGLIEGIGNKFAKLIVNKFGEDTINIIEKAPEKLLEIPKIGIKRVNAIKKSWIKHKDIKDLMIFLSDCGISTSIAHKIYKIYEQDSINKLKTNPYSLVDDVYGVGFKTADIIATKLGQAKESYNRCRAGIFYILSELSKEGNCYASLNDLIEKGKELLDISEEIITMTFSHLKNINELICEENDKIIYLPPFYSQLTCEKESNMIK